jgi:hypothetical protein
MLVNCAEILSDELRGYSPDTVVELQEQSLPAEECEQLLALYEVIYG